jgi:hypothetical protein
LIAARLKKEFEDLRWTQEDALDMADRLVRVATGTTGQINLSFDMAQCEKAIDPRWGQAAVDAGVAGDAADRKRHVCERTFQSAMFRAGDVAGQYVFADRNTADLFLARWVNKEITNDCSLVAKHQEILRSDSVIRFLAGQPWGSKCLAQVVATGCTRMDPTKLTSAVNDGLVIGESRIKVFADARAAATSLQPQGCIKDVLDNLEKLMGGAP